MNIRLDSIDADWAWHAYKPNSEHPWNKRLAAHLFRRAAFGGNYELYDQALSSSPEVIVRQLMDQPAQAAEQLNQQRQLAQTLLATGNAKQLSAWWVHAMLSTPRPLVERMTLFWHGHFATSAEKVGETVMYRQNELLRQSALGSFRQLVHDIARDPAMLVYLDSTTNRKSHPNENFARELMELFCLGEGNYSERDVQELARCFTGWEIRQDKFRFNRFQHDGGTKTIFGRASQFPDSEAIDWILEQPQSAVFVVNKLFRLFVADEPSPPHKLLQPLADELRTNDWKIGPIIQRILTSQLFYSVFAVGKKVRSPVDLAVGLMRSLDGSTNSQQLGQELHQLGQGLFYPPNVKGWDGGRAWINSSTILSRANCIGRMVRDDKTRFAGLKLAEYIETKLKLSSPNQWIEYLEEMWLANPLRPAVRERLNANFSRNTDTDQWSTELLQTISALPEAQLG